MNKRWIRVQGVGFVRYKLMVNGSFTRYFIDKTRAGGEYTVYCRSIFVDRGIGNLGSFTLLGDAKDYAELQAGTQEVSS